MEAISSFPKPDTNIGRPGGTAVSSVTIGFVIRLNKPNYGIHNYGVQ